MKFTSSTFADFTSKKGKAKQKAIEGGVLEYEKRCL